MRLSFIPAPLIKVSMASRGDLSQFIIGGIYLPPTGNSYVRLWKVNADLTSGGEIPFTDEAGKDDSVFFYITRLGHVIVTVSEALGATGAGSTSQPAIYIIPDVFPDEIVGTGIIDQTARNMATNAQNTANVVTNNLLALKVSLSSLFDRIKIDLHL